MKSTLAAMAIALSTSLTLAQEPSTVSIWALLGGGYSASVITVSASITTLELVCPTRTASDEDLMCFADTLTLTTGANTFGASIADGGATGSIGCSVGGTTTAECTQVYTSTDEATATPETQIGQFNAEDLSFLPITITGGLEMLGGGAEATPTPTESGAHSSAASTGSAAPSGTSGAAPEATTGAATRGSIPAGAALGAFGAVAAAFAL